MHNQFIQKNFQVITAVIISTVFLFLSLVAFTTIQGQFRHVEALLEKQTNLVVNEFHSTIRNGKVLSKSIQSHISDTKGDRQEIWNILNGYKDESFGYALVNSKGKLIASSFTGIHSDPINLPKRDYIKTILDNPTKDVIYLGEPITGQTSGLAQIPLSSAAFDKEGQFIGVILTAARMDALERRVMQITQKGVSLHVKTDQGKELVRMNSPMEGDVAEDAWFSHTDTSTSIPYTITAYYNNDLLVQELTAALVPRMAESLLLLAILGGLLYLMQRKVVEPGIRSVAVAGEYKQALDQSEAENAAKSEFIAHMSRELRTPLNAIIGFSEMLQSGAFGDMSAKQQEYMTDIRRSGEHLLAMVNDILDVSKIDSGNITFRKQKTDVNALLRDCIRDVYPMARKRGVELEVALGHGLPPMEVDNKRFRQVVLNLLSNAVKFTDAGGEVVLSGWSDEEGVKIQVADTGIGMSDNELKRAMRKFGRVEHVHCRDYDGAGLGLPLAKKLTMLMGGWFDVSSAKGVGTTVTMRFAQKVDEIESNTHALQDLTSSSQANSIH